MARSAHAYVRGSTVKFYEWLDSSRRCQFPDGPPVWICGDCHVGNLGPLADAKGRVLIQIRDLDQTVIGNPAHDLIRLGLSLASASRGSDLPGVTTAKILEELVAGYQAALSGSFETDRTSPTGPSPYRRYWRNQPVEDGDIGGEGLDSVKPTIPHKILAVLLRHFTATAGAYDGGISHPRPIVIVVTGNTIRH